jgi:hypothetical protein
MTVLLKTVDKVPGANAVEGPQLSFAVRHVSAREIVRARVELEVERHNGDDAAYGFLEFLVPTRHERELNGPRRKRRRPLDVDRQVATALEAVRKGRVIILFNGVQVSDLDAPLLVTPISEARFLRLVPLAGG